jgi:hypothetical protein
MAASQLDSERGNSKDDSPGETSPQNTHRTVSIVNPSEMLINETMYIEQKPI